VRLEVWRAQTKWGVEQIGDYGTWVYFAAMATQPTADDGTAAVTALTKCDAASWCDEIQKYDATMTREGYNSGTMSHAWGTAAIPAVVHGVMGLRQTAPGFASFEIKPTLGKVASASLKVPSPRGFITINATSNGQVVAVGVPCNTEATLCARLPAAGAEKQLRLALDGEVVAQEDVRSERLHACVERLGCGALGEPRTLSWV